MTEIKNRIADLRKKRGLTQQELAGRIGITVWHMNKMENHAKSVTTQNALKIADVLGVTLNDIFLQ